MQQILPYVKSNYTQAANIFNEILPQSLDNFVSNLCCIFVEFYIGLKSRTRRWMDPTSLYVLKKTKEPRN